jgi:carnosine N-methyltransferase
MGARRVRSHFPSLEFLLVSASPSAATAHMLSISRSGLNSFQQRAAAERQRAFFALPSHHQAAMMAQPVDILERFRQLDAAIETNYTLALDIFHTGLDWAGIGQLSECIRPNGQSRVKMDKHTKLPTVPGLDTAAKASDYHKALTVVRSYYREWSEGGAVEREICFEPLLNYLDAHFSSIATHERHKLKVLNPGCGLGRFVFELALHGYSAEGCEVSYHMVIGAMHAMNTMKEKDEYRLYPFAFSGSNHRSPENRFRSVMVPDVCVRDINELAERSEVLPTDRLGIASGDFSTVYKKPEYKEEYDAIAMVYFLDTASNPLTYIEAALHCLKPGGIWLNLGPLKWHFEPYGDAAPSDPPQHPEATAGTEQDYGVAGPGGVELTEKDILQLLVVHGFELLHYESPDKRPSGYIHDRNSMETNVYLSSFWVARKKLTEDESTTMTMKSDKME